jgi:hypothetical protein
MEQRIEKKDPELRFVAWLRRDVGSIQWKVFFQPEYWTEPMDEVSTGYEWKRAQWLDEKK